MAIDFNTIIGFSGTLFGLFGIIISIYSYRKSKKTKKLAVTSESNVLISKTLSQYENLQISYNNENISSLTSTIVKIKNIGTDIVEPTDLIPSSPIIITTTQKFLLNKADQYEIETTNKKNKVSLTKINESSLQLVFEFLNPKDEIYISLLHTGEITVSGDLKTNEIKNYTKKKYESNNSVADDEIIYNKSNHHYSLLELTFIMIICLFVMTYMFLKIYPIIAGNNGFDIDIFNFTEFYLIIMVFMSEIFIFLRRK